MSATEAEVVGQDSVAPVEEEHGVAGAYRRSIDNLKSGNLGVLPIVLGIAFIVVFFSFKATNFFTANNFDNVIIQMAGTAMLAYGVVFVLLLGEIDLSIGYLSGIAALAVVLISHNLHDVFEVADRITVLRLGRDIGVYEREHTTQQEIVQAITAGVPTKVAGIADTAPELAT